MSWNYRIIEFGTHLALHEVYYDERGKVRGWTAEPAGFISDLEGSSAEIVDSLARALDDARRRPVLRERDLPQGTMG